MISPFFGLLCPLLSEVLFPLRSVCIDIFIVDADRFAELHFIWINVYARK